ACGSIIIWAVPLRELYCVGIIKRNCARVVVIVTESLPRLALGVIELSGWRRASVIPDVD
ncbi:MAG: hypothetical protein P8N17_02110, partial [Luminiphilus sp.]|nr:hypothetical protein [Luminiphilus sp.]